ncbi:MAG: hypothetical protein ABS35_29080 [Kaistia sp. SCN 65-12]|nr:MAG: hypothetical protein ABS35_29080 [Kaistia sp. SCN 65-12]
MSMTIETYVAAAEKLAEADQRKADPFRPFLIFLAGHLTFTTAILVAALASLPREGARLTPPMAAALGGVLAWMAVSAMAASLVALAVQALRKRFIMSGRKPEADWSRLAGALCLLAVLPGVMAVFYCLRAGAALIGGTQALPSIADTVRIVF